MFNGLGWVATAVFAASYFSKTSNSYASPPGFGCSVVGIWMNARPIIVANVIVAALAVYSDWKQPRIGSVNNS